MIKDKETRILSELYNLFKKVQEGNDQEMAQSERNSHSTNRGVGKTKMTLSYLYQKHIVSRVSSYSPIGGHSVTRI